MARKTRQAKLSTQVRPNSKAVEPPTNSALIVSGPVVPPHASEPRVQEASRSDRITAGGPSGAHPNSYASVAARVLTVSGVGDLPPAIPLQARSAWAAAPNSPALSAHSHGEPCSFVAASSVPPTPPTPSPKRKLDIHKMFQVPRQLPSPPSLLMTNSTDPADHPLMASSIEIISEPSSLDVDQPSGPTCSSQPQSTTSPSPQFAHTFSTLSLPPHSPPAVTEEAQQYSYLVPPSVPRTDGTDVAPHQHSHLPPYPYYQGYRPPQMLAPVQQPWVPSYYNYRATGPGQAYWAAAYSGSHFPTSQNPHIPSDSQLATSTPLSPRLGTVTASPLQGLGMSDDSYIATNLTEFAEGSRRASETASSQADEAGPSGSHQKCKEPAVTKPAPSLSTLAESFINIEGQLAMVLRSLGETQSRLTIIESTVSCAQVDILMGQQGVAGLRTQLSALQEFTGVSRGHLFGLDRQTDVVEDQTNSLAESFDGHQSRLEAVRGTIGNTQQVVAGLGDSVHATRQQLHDGVGHRLQGGGKNPDHMSASCFNIKEDLLDREGAFGQARSAVSAGLELVPTQTQHSAGGYFSPNNSDGARPSQEARHSPKQWVDGLYQRLPALEAKTEKLARAFGETRENLSSIHNYLQTTQQRLTGLSGRIPDVEAKLTESFGQSREEISVMRMSLATTRDRLNELDLRMAAVEDKADRLEFLSERGKEPLVGRNSPFDFDDEPTLFPERGGDSLGTIAGPSRVDSLLWLPLPKPLEDMT